jgi:hypothetical protein
MVMLEGVDRLLDDGDLLEVSPVTEAQRDVAFRTRRRGCGDLTGSRTRKHGHKHENCQQKLDSVKFVSTHLLSSIPIFSECFQISISNFQEILVPVFGSRPRLVDRHHSLGR